MNGKLAKMIRKKLRAQGIDTNAPTSYKQASSDNSTIVTTGNRKKYKDAKATVLMAKRTHTI